MSTTRVVPAAIGKLAAAPSYRRPWLRFASARHAMRAFLEAARIGPRQRVLLPGYIGWSAREGSGVFDPIRELGVAHGFYRMDDRLHIDLPDLERQLSAGDVRVVVLIHYFGAPDPRWEHAVALARRHGALVLEDSAHAMLTDLVEGSCGRAGDATFFSLHKLLPVPDGGLLLVNPHSAIPLEQVAATMHPGDAPWDYDLRDIAAVRVRNGRLLHELIVADQRLEGQLQPLWDFVPDGIVPQTYPVVIHHASRDQLYFRLNEAGFGVVSLYHTMIDELAMHDHGDAHALSRRILNLPVHQDVCAEQLRALVRELGRQLAAPSTRVA
jgi:dTDP-4-amino-4,6-dideoxygalactose transaminase